MNDMHKLECITLIGMPGSGKSTLGIMLAKNLALSFVDTDVLIQSTLGQTLQHYLNLYGYKALREKEEKVILEAQFSRQVISTGGSVVYSAMAMQKLKALGIIIYLDISFPTLLHRVQNQTTRGIACPDHYTLEDIYSERKMLYQHYADITIENDNYTQEQAVSAIMKALLSET